jgi:anti-sigma B factor antagonist
MPPQLTVQATPEPGYTLVSVAGELDIATAPELRDCLVPLLADHPTLVIDLDRVSFCDATGLGVLVGAANRARANRARLHLVCSGPNIRRLFDLTGLARRLPLAHTLGEALAALPLVADTRPAPAAPSCPRPGHRAPPAPGSHQPGPPRPSDRARRTRGAGP